MHVSWCYGRIMLQCWVFIAVCHRIKLVLLGIAARILAFTAITALNTVQPIHFSLSLSPQLFSNSVLCLLECKVDSIRFPPLPLLTLLWATVGRKTAFKFSLLFQSCDYGWPVVFCTFEFCSVSVLVSCESPYKVQSYTGLSTSILIFICMCQRIWGLRVHNYASAI